MIINKMYTPLLLICADSSCLQPFSPTAVKAWVILFCFDFHGLRFQLHQRLGAGGDQGLVENCHSAHPIFFSSNGVTVFTLDRPGLFYFISGVSGRERPEDDHQSVGTSKPTQIC
ncbi:hypothetical protein PRUPE_5G214900 [Prunus persica]|uniref:Uncharacterized protein n=1 Tax=Prunus persica TaxID=3760 RepID=A0A251PBU2_PRUPE|nr:hypothetical protein PRUPE_5G214900 [Prunus persica]ONI09056.1 hypothetical protein PRUPE_5G214900 [Prunus persica]